MLQAATNPCLSPHFTGLREMTLLPLSARARGARISVVREEVWRCRVQCVVQSPLGHNSISSFRPALLVPRLGWLPDSGAAVIGCCESLSLSAAVAVPDRCG